MIQSLKLLILQIFKEIEVTFIPFSVEERKYSPTICLLSYNLGIINLFENSNLSESIKSDLLSVSPFEIVSAFVKKAKIIYAVLS